MNIAEILKYCPKGTKLYSTIFGEVTFDKIDIDEKYLIIVYKLDSMKTSFTEEGHYTEYPNSECVLFPSKDQRDWSKFRLSVKKGDIMMDVNGKCPFIATGEFYHDIAPKYICGINSLGKFQLGCAEMGWTSIFYIPASKEVKKELFDKMAEAGYKWNANTLELEKIESKFKEGDILVMKDDNTLFLFTGVIKDGIAQVCCLPTNGTSIDCGVSISSLQLVTITERNKFYSYLVKRGYKYDKERHKLVKQEFKPFDKVLVRNNNSQIWMPSIFLNFINKSNFKYFCAGGLTYCQCIPYEGNEYILGTTDSPM